jgi:hypothetical protein
MGGPIRAALSRADSATLRQRVSALLMSAAVVLLASLSVGPGVAAADNCPSLKMFVVTGSGEHSGFGHVLGQVVSDVYAKDTNNASASRVEYPAVSVLAPSVVQYNWSVGIGITALQNDLRPFLAQCHSTPVFLLGYSQGAQVVGDVYLRYLSDAEQNRISGVVLFGDPEFCGGQNAPIAVGSYDAALNGISTSVYPSAPEHRFSSGDSAKVRSYCAEYDPVCNYTKYNAVQCGFFSCTHILYASLQLTPSLTYTQHAAKFILSRWGGYAPPSAPPSGGGQPGVGAPPTPARAGVETAGGSARTWTSPTSLTQNGPSVAAGQTVPVVCRVTGARVADGNTWWYQLAGSPWNGAYYATADAFYNNGATSGSLLGTPFVDTAIPQCAGVISPPPPPPSAYGETTGGVAHTWTNYQNAGGTQGPSIPSNATVQITCRLTGFRVSDGNTWWYQIASSPWSNTYYVSADAFYNNGATSGSLVGTPFYDPNVPIC